MSGSDLEPLTDDEQELLDFFALMTEEDQQHFLKVLVMASEAQGSLSLDDIEVLLNSRLQ